MCVHALIPTAASTYQLYRRELRKNPSQSSPPPAARTAPAAARRAACPQPPPRDARPQRRGSFVPPRGCAEPFQPDCPPPPPPRAYPGPRLSAAPPARRGCTPAPAPARRGVLAAAALRGGGSRSRQGSAESWAGSADRQRDTPTSTITGGSPALVQGPQPRQEGADRGALLAIVLGECLWGCAPCPSSLQLHRGVRGDEPAPEGRRGEELHAESGIAGERQKKGPPPTTASHQISRSGATQNPGPVAPSRRLREVKVWCVRGRTGPFASPVSGQLEKKVTRCVHAPYTNSSGTGDSLLRTPRLVPRGVAWDSVQIALQNTQGVGHAMEHL